MFHQWSRWMHLSQVIMQRLTLVIIVGLAGAASIWSLAAMAGLAPWLGLEIALGSRFDAGAAVQLILTLFMVGLCFFLPMNWRVMQLENSHRDFTISMWDVASAYRAVHAADRAGMFQLKSEYDGVRDRLTYLRSHPDLASLEPELLELAAQMSYESRELASIYSDERIERARTFLRQRQEEVALMKDRIRSAHATCHELKRWLQSVEMDEAAVRLQVARLKEELDEVWPALDMHLEAGEPRAQAEIVEIRRVPAE